MSAGMRRRLIALVGVCLVSGGSLASGAAAAANSTAAYLVLTSARPASGVVTVKQTIDVGEPWDVFPAKFSGDYVGYLVSSLRGEPLLGRVRVPNMGFDQSSDTVPLWFASRNLPPGRYRVTLLGTGPLSVSIPISGRSDQHVRVDGKAHAFARLIRPSSLPSTDAGEPVNNFGAPVPPGHYELGSLTRFAHGNYTQADVGDECFTTSQSCAAEGSVASDGFFIVGNSGEGAIASGWTTSPMDLGPGVNATFDDVDAGLNAGQAGLVVLVAAPKHRGQRSAGQGGSSGPRIVALNGG